METTSNPTVSLFGIDFDLTVLAMSLLTVIIVFGVVFWSSRKMTIKPKGKQNVLEFIYEFVNSTISQNLGKFTKNYSLLLFVIFTFVFTANNLGLLVSVKSEHYNFWSSPTSNFGVTITLSLIITLISHIEGIRKKGLKGYLKGYLSPYPAMLPMNILEQLTNLASLALRLFGNIYSGTYWLDSSIGDLVCFCSTCILCFEPCLGCLFSLYRLYPSLCLYYPKFKLYW